MARQQSKEQKDTVERVMHEFKHGELRSGGDGAKVKNCKQAIAIALTESGSSNQESPKKNRENLKKTKSRERRGTTGRAEAEGVNSTRRKNDGTGSGATKAELYAKARKQNVPSRSRMTKAELQQALT
jgi:hypothetical protein